MMCAAAGPAQPSRTRAQASTGALLFSGGLRRRDEWPATAKSTPSHLASARIDLERAQFDTGVMQLVGETACLVSDEIESLQLAGRQSQMQIVAMEVNLVGAVRPDAKDHVFVLLDLHDRRTRHQRALGDHQIDHLGACVRWACTGRAR